MDDAFTLGLTAAITLFFLLCGILDILNNPVIKWLLIAGYSAVLVRIIVSQSNADKQENPPE